MTPSQILEAMYDNRLPLVFGHSGAQAYAPANTLPAFELALKQGADGTELDVHRSKDGHPVVIHDFTVDASTDGHGGVADLTLTELKALDAGSWFSPDFRDVRIPTLDEVFEAVGKQTFINVELKSKTQETDGLEQCVADCIQRHAMQRRVLISSFNPLALRRFRVLMPEVPLGFLYGLESPMLAHDLIAGFAVEALHPEHGLIDEALMEKSRADHQPIHAWTINDIERARHLADIGVAIIMTDIPDQILRALGHTDAPESVIGHV